MNYIQIELGGKLRGWKVNQMTLELWGRLIDVQSHNTSTAYAAVYAGLMSNCYVKQQEPDFTFEQVCDWVDDLNNEKGEKVLELVKKTFEESQAYIDVLNKLNAQLRTSKAEEQKDKKKIEKKK